MKTLMRSEGRLGGPRKEEPDKKPFQKAVGSKETETVGSKLGKQSSRKGQPIKT